MVEMNRINLAFKFGLFEKHLAVIWPFVDGYLALKGPEELATLILDKIITVLPLVGISTYGRWKWAFVGCRDYLRGESANVGGT